VLAAAESQGNGEVQLVDAENEREFEGEQFL
jgi:hypothetical protein